jgi:hypothetical protein
VDDDAPFNPPSVTDEDICWVARLLSLPKSSFYGEDGTDPRQEVIKCKGQIDVAACPGSGKTTLLVAKLAIIASKWRYSTRGVCALSHTNVARSEIETRLGNTSVGRRLLSYPHYIGTIHGFMNEFLAMPWLRSLGCPVKIIDTEICEIRRWGKLNWGSRSYLKKNHVGPSDIRIVDASFRLAKKNGQFPCGDHTETYKDVQRACREAGQEGYYCYDDMFLWAKELMEKVPHVVHVLRARFPILFIDEAQDNSEDQSALLYRIFRQGGAPVIRQRFGDSNQAIFDSLSASEVTTDSFPDSAIQKDLPNSYRFGQRIADIANPLGVHPHGLKGQGPKKKCLASGVADGRHTLFLFDDGSVTKVLDSYGELLVGTFSEQELSEGTFTAVGQIHTRSDDVDERKFPRCVGDFWAGYDPQLTSRDPKPSTLVQYIRVGMARAERVGEAYPVVEKVAEGLLRLAAMAEGATVKPHHAYNHRCVSDLLPRGSVARERYEALITEFAVERETLTKATWESTWESVAREIGETISGASLPNPEADAFLLWNGDSDVHDLSALAERTRDNVYRYPNNHPRVKIRVGSIHSVKGETHTATLVLETFWYGEKGLHNLEMLLPWLDGTNSGGLKVSDRQKRRLKVHYVAMTRPTHLLCLAMKRSTFQSDQGDLSKAITQKLESRGWEIRSV